MNTMETEKRAKMKKNKSAKNEEKFHAVLEVLLRKSSM